MKTSPLVSIIIVNWNGGQVFEDCLKSLAKINYPNWELIVVDNGSSDQSDKLAFQCKRIRSIQIIKNKTNLGFAQANNQGFKKSTGDYILLLNNDTVVPSDFLSILVSRVEKDKNIGVIQPKIFLMGTDRRLDNAGSFLTKIGFLYHWGFMEKDGPSFNKERLIFSAKGACMLIRRSVIEKNGLFDDDFVSYFEESDFCWRVWLSGNKILYYPKTAILHRLGFTIRRLNVLNLNYHYYKNRICSLIKNLSTVNLVLVLLPHLIISMGIMMVFAIQLKFDKALMIIRAINWNLENLSQTLQKRKIVQQERVVSDRKLFQTVSQKINWMKYWQDFKRIQADFRREKESGLTNEKAFG